jgi:predicted nucleotidyltransferase
MDRFENLRAILVPALRPYVTRIAVFGSYARGEETPGSDIDVLVELRAAGKRPSLGLSWFKLEEDLGVRLGRPVEMVTLEALSPYVRPYVQRDEVELYAEG